jgi:hypothetical protein
MGEGKINEKYTSVETAIFCCYYRGFTGCRRGVGPCADHCRRARRIGNTALGVYAATEAVGIEREVTPCT